MEEVAHLERSGFPLYTKSTETEEVEKQQSFVGCSSTHQRSKKWRHGISKEAEKRITAAEALEGTLLQENIIQESFHVVFIVMTQETYVVHIKAEPSCTCPDFQKRERDQKPYLACKHLYFIYIKVLGLHRNKHMVIHQPTLSTEELSFILHQPHLMVPIA